MQRISVEHFRWLLAILVFVASAQQLGSETFTLTANYPPSAGIYNTLTTIGTTILAKDGGNVGIGVASPTSKLELPQNTAFKIGHGYVSSDGNSAYLATNEWWNGTGWTANKAGLLFQGNGTSGFSWYSHDAAGAQTLLMQLDASSNLNVKGMFGSNSDLRYKQNVETLNKGIDNILRLRGVGFRWANKRQDAKPQIGVIAQDVEKVFPEAVKTDPQGHKSVAYGNLVAPLIEGAKDLQAEIVSLRRQAEEQQAVILELEKHAH